MTLRRTLTGLVLCVMALTLFMGCVESGRRRCHPPRWWRPRRHPPHRFTL